MKTAADSGKLFGSVTAGDIVAAIKKAGGPNLDKRIVRSAQSAHQSCRHASGHRCTYTPKLTSSSHSTSSARVNRQHLLNPGGGHDRAAPGLTVLCDRCERGTAIVLANYFRRVPTATCNSLNVGAKSGRKPTRPAQ